MRKLYRFSVEAKEYWETWQAESGDHIVHWGEIGTKGQSKTVKGSLLRPASKIVRDEMKEAERQGFSPIELDDHAVLLIEYPVDGMGTEQDLEKRYRLQDRMDETLGWTGLGSCDGGSIGSGSMEVCNYVVDFHVAKQVIERDLAGTEFADYKRIFDEDAE